jgi:Cysteine-rich secretory protein family
MTLTWKFPALACLLGIVASCTVNPTNLPVRGSIPKSPVAVVAVSTKSIVGTNAASAIVADMNFSIPNPPSSAAGANAAMARTDPPMENKQNPIPVFDQRILAEHNRERVGLGLRPLSWSPALAQMAQRWADYLAATGRFEHATERRLVPEGENLWAGTKGYYPPEAQVDAWIREKRFFRPGLFPNNSITGKVEDVGHYTQVVWRGTTQLGCGEATDAHEDVLVCRYDEAGNYRGEYPF